MAWGRGAGRPVSWRLRGEWVRGYAGMTGLGGGGSGMAWRRGMAGGRGRGRPVVALRADWIPAYAGMTAMGLVPAFAE